MLGYVGTRQAMPDGQDDLLPVYLLLHESIELLLGPLLLLAKERRAEDNDAEPRVGQPFLYLPSEAVADLQLPAVVPYLEPARM